MSLTPGQSRAITFRLENRAETGADGPQGWRESGRTTSLREVLEQLSSRGLRRTGDGWEARCPAHDDAHASLSVAEGASGKVLLYCHAGCTFEEILTSLGAAVDPTVAYSSSSACSKRREIATYAYRDETGTLLFQVVRYEPKAFSQRRPGGGGRWLWKLGDVRRVLYRLPELVGAPGTAPVFIVEGEKDADALAAVGLVATTNVGGAGKWRSEYSHYFEGRQVVIVPDNDEPGRRHAENIRQELEGIAAKIVLLILPDLPVKGDVSDWLAAGNTAGALIALVEAAEQGAPALASVDGTEAHVWRDPRRLPDDLLPVPPFDDALLPDAFRPWLVDVRERTQCPAEYPAVSAMVAVGSLVGRTCVISPRKLDDWSVTPNLWGAIVGPPSSMKSPALKAALRPLAELEREAEEQHERGSREHAVAMTEGRARRRALEKKLERGIAKGDERLHAEARRELAALQGVPAPTERRYIVNDATVEKLGELLNQNPRGLLHVRDELTGWFASLERQGHEGDRAFFLEAWNGDSPYTYDRIGRGTLKIRSACVSMLGGIQPGPLSQYLRGAFQGGRGADGLIQRFQLLVYPDRLSTWEPVERSPDADALAKVQGVFRRLDALDPKTGGTIATPERSLRFDPDAQRFFDRWHRDLQNRLRSGVEDPVIEAHLAKYPSLLPSLALLFHLVDDLDAIRKPVSQESAERASAWCDLLEAHARRVYQVVTKGQMNAARALLRKLRDGSVKEPFGARDIYRQGWTGLEDREVVEAALAVLVEYGWLAGPMVSETGGRPRGEYRAHPSLRGAK